MSILIQIALVSPRKIFSLALHYFPYCTLIPARTYTNHVITSHVLCKDINGERDSPANLKSTIGSLCIGSQLTG